MDNTTCIIDSKGRKEIWRNFNTQTAKMGIIKETIHPKVLEGNYGRIHLDELINPAMVILSDNSREVEMNLLNNARNSMVDNFRLVKWIFHETDEIKNRLQGLERMEGDVGNDRINNLEKKGNQGGKKDGHNGDLSPQHR